MTSKKPRPIITCITEINSKLKSPAYCPIPGSEKLEVLAAIGHWIQKKPQ